MGSIPTRSRHPGRRARSGLLPRGRLPPPAAGGGSAANAGLYAALLALGVLLAAPGTMTAQEPDTARAGGPPPPAAAEPDTAAAPPVSPLGAFARSFVLPGWGQAEVDKPIRGAFYFAAEAASLWMVFKSQAKLSAARRAAGDLPPGEQDPLVESRTSQREDWIVLSVFVALMSGVDAWVSTHLYDFEGELEPPEDGSAGARVSFSVPLDLP